MKIENNNRKKIPTGYGMVQTAVMRLPISLGAKALYALLCSYTGGSQFCWPSVKTMQNDLMCSERKIYDYLKELEKNKLIIKSRLYNDARNNHKYEVLYIDQPVENKQIESKQYDDLGDVQYDVLGKVASVAKRQSINNNNLNNNNIKESTLDKSSSPHTEKIKHQDHVYLTPDEYTSLTNLYKEPIVKDYIERLSDYIGSKGKRYRSHYYTIRNWLRRDNVEKKKIYITCRCGGNVKDGRCQTCGAEHGKS